MSVSLIDGHIDDDVQKLKPCPFCGGEAEVYGIKNLFHIRCKHCGAQTGLFIAKETAILAWNRRVDNG